MPSQGEKKLGSEYEVSAPDENCRFSLYVLNSLRFWFDSFPTPDIICWNAGLWDTAILYPEDGCFVSLDQYLENMKKILREMKKTGTKIIFLTTTTVAEEKQYLPGPMPPRHRNVDILQYNKAIVQAFQDEDIIVADLFSLMYPNPEQYLRDDMIHPNEAGMELISSTITESIHSIGLFENPHQKSGSGLKKDEKTIQ